MTKALPYLTVKQLGFDLLGVVELGERLATEVVLGLLKLAVFAAIPVQQYLVLEVAKSLHTDIRHEVFLPVRKAQNVFLEQWLPAILHFEPLSLAASTSSGWDVAATLAGCKPLDVAALMPSGWELLTASAAARAPAPLRY